MLLILNIQMLKSSLLKVIQEMQIHIVSLKFLLCIAGQVKKLNITLG